jgi:CDP-diacylglycerol--serine O-phosphatidyltransferase
MEKTSRKPKSIFRSFAPADVVTLANASCGTAGILLCLYYLAGDRTARIWPVFLLLILAAVLDVLDGLIARRSKKLSILGADLDSLADIVSFGVAPAVLGFTLGLRGLWDAAVLIYFVNCGISRLARFNVTAFEISGGTGKVKYFEGTPIPTSIVIVAVLAFAFSQGWIEDLLPWGEWRIGPAILHPLSILYAVSGSLMISSSLRIPKF